jgi:hypothetical protein
MHWQGLRQPLASCLCHEQSHEQQQEQRRGQQQQEEEQQAPLPGAKRAAKGSQLVLGQATSAAASACDSPTCIGDDLIYGSCHIQRAA